MNRRWGQWFGTYARKKNDFWNNKIIENIHNEILEPSEEKEDEYKKEVKKEILEDLENEYNSIDEEAIFTITLQENNQEKYLGDIEIFKDIFIQESVKKFHQKLNVDAQGEGNCFLCGKAGTVYGFASPFATFTLKPKGFASNFDRENAWKQLSICRECGITCMKGREFLDTYLKYNLIGYYSRGDYIKYTYYVIPSVTYSDKYSTMKEIYQEIKDFEGYDYKEGLMNEEHPYGLLARKDNINLNFIFCKEKQKDFFDIIKTVEDVPPSWIKKVYSEFEKMNNKYFFAENNLKDVLGNKWEGGLRNGKWEGKSQNNNLKGLIRSFFPASNTTGKYDKQFLDVIGNLLSETEISKNLLIRAFIREIRDKHINENEWEEKLLSLQSLYLYSYVNKLDLLGGLNIVKKENALENLEGGSGREKINDFFEDFPDALSNNAKKAVFLEGVLTRFLLDIQSQERNSTPFRSKLRGLRLDEVKVKNLFPEITEKLRQYEAPYYSWLEEMISKYFIAADEEGWNINKNEISYYFALGLNLGRVFKKKNENEEN